MKVNLIENKEHKGIELYFESFPYAASRNILKGAGFKWHNSKKCWYAVENPDRRSIAEKVMKREKDHKPYIPEPVKPEKVTEAPEVVKPETPEPEEVKKSSLGVEVKPEKRIKKTDIQRAFEYIVKQAPPHMKNPEHGSWCGTCEGKGYAVDGHQLMITEEAIEAPELDPIERDKIHKIYDPARNGKNYRDYMEVKLDFTAKELKAAISQLKKGKRNAKVVYTFESGLTVNAFFLYNALLATGSDTIIWTDKKAPLFMEGEKTKYMFLPINSKNEDPAGLHLIG